MLPAGGSPVGGRSRVGRGRTLLLGALLLVVVAGGVALLIEAIVSGFDADDSTKAVAGHTDDFPPGSVTSRRLQSEAGGGGLVWITRPPGGEVLALSRTSSFAPRRLGGLLGGVETRT